MNYGNLFFRALKLEANGRSLKAFSELSQVPVERLRYYNDTNTLPSGVDLENICRSAGITTFDLMLRIGRLDHTVIEAIQKNSDAVLELIGNQTAKTKTRSAKPHAIFSTQLGRLYQSDCLDLLSHIDSDSIDVVFADPPFNLAKDYPSGIDDSRKALEYLQWCERWLNECVRVLKQGGSLFVWNLPKWNTSIAEFLNGRLTFRHWISVDIKYRLPISGRLYPSHYSLLYFCKGARPRVFHPDRLPMEVCPECKTDLRDYGGYKNKMNPLGVNLSDVWTDIAPVRHAKYKRREGANELPIRLMDRIIELASNEGDLVFDPFGGSGTTYLVAELKQRRWLGAELGPVDDIRLRFERIAEERQILTRLRLGYNKLFTDETRTYRERNGLWTSESVSIEKNGCKHEQLKFQQLTNQKELMVETATGSKPS
jgi:site-specific DNA-methyltransferase (adenine-specific)